MKRLKLNFEIASTCFSEQGFRKIIVETMEILLSIFLELQGSVFVIYHDQHIDGNVMCFGIINVQIDKIPISHW